MSKYINGWLPYGSDDEDVIFYSDLKSTASLTDHVGTALVSAGVFPVAGNTNTYDPVKGLKPGSAGGLTFVLSAANAAAVDNSFQLSFQIQTALLACTNADSVRPSSNGDVITGEQRIIESFSGAVGTGQNQILKESLSTNNKFLNAYYGVGTGLNDMYFHGISGAASSPPYVHDANHGEFTTVNIGRVGNSIFYALDGVIYSRRTTPPPGTPNFLSWVIGSDRGIQFFVTDHYIRNFQLAKRGPVFSCPPILSYCYVVSDSIYANVSNFSNPLGDAVAEVGMTVPIVAKGMRFGQVTINTNGGATIQPGADSLDDDVDAAIAAKPSVVYYRGGHNDISAGTAPATVYATLQDQIERMLGQNGNPDTSIQKVVVGNMTSWMGASATATAQQLADVQTWNGIIAGLESWWNTTYPSAAGQVVLVDNYNDLGAETPDALTFNGQVSGAFNDFHPHARGAWKLGKSYTDALLNSI